MVLWLVLLAIGVFVLLPLAKPDYTLANVVFEVAAANSSGSIFWLN
jgi:Trk-type K+ transport system membrane component